MAATLKYQGEQRDAQLRTTSYTTVWQGTKEEMTTLATTTCAPGTTITGKGKVKQARISQDSGAVWICTVVSETGGGSSVNDEPYTTVGQKSCTLSGTMLSLPVESHPNYKTCWNHSLAVAPEEVLIPAWFITATDTVIASEADRAKYKWVKSQSEVPEGWGIPLSARRLEAADTYGFPTYTIREKARYNSATAAGNAIAKVLGKRGGSPSETFGVTGSREWLCEDAQISWEGDGWYSSLTWTLSGDSNGWSSRLYEQVVSNG